MGKRLKGLADYIADLAASGKLQRVSNLCSPNLEIGEISHRALSLPEDRRTLLFENSGYSFPVATNLYASRVRMLEMLRSESYSQIGERIRSVFQLMTRPKVGLARQLSDLWSLRQVKRYLPKHLKGTAPAQEVILHHPDLTKLPITTSWPKDGGAFITLPQVITQDPETKQRNVGMYRMQVIDAQTTGMHWHTHKTGAMHMRKYAQMGQRMPVAVALGGDPLLAYCASAPLPEGLDEWMLTGFLRNEPVYLKKGITVDLDIPAEADIVIEGYVDPAEDRFWEGPFGDHTGFYSLTDWYPKFHVTCITHRKDAVYPSTIVGVPPMEDAYIAEATEQIFLPLLQLSLSPELKDLHLPSAGVAHNLAIAAINQLYPGQSNRIANLFWGTGQMMFTKYVVCVDPEVNVRDYRTVIATIAKNATSSDRFMLGYGPLDTLDHACFEKGVGSKLLIDATRKKEDSYETTTASLRWEKISQIPGAQMLWLGEEEPLALIMGVETSWRNAPSAEEIVDKLQELRLSVPRMVCLFDSNAPIEDPYLMLWIALGNTAPDRDLQILQHEGNTLLILNAQAKLPAPEGDRWPNPVASSEATIKLVNERWESLGLGSLIESPSLKVMGYTFGNEAVAKREE